MRSRGLKTPGYIQSSVPQPGGRDPCSPGAGASVARGLQPPGPPEHHNANWPVQAPFSMTARREPSRQIAVTDVPASEIMQSW